MIGREQAVRQIASSPTHVLTGSVTSGTANPDYFIFVSNTFVSKSGAPLSVIVNPLDGEVRTSYYNRSLMSVQVGSGDMVLSIDKERQICADYDRGADVLYIALGLPREDEGEDRPRGIVLRYGADDDRPSGVTIIGYVGNGWSREVGRLAKIITSHLSVDSEEVIRVIKRAEGSAR
jgi:hypothetical protein